MKKFTTVASIILLFSVQAWAQTTLSFQGKLIEDGTVVNGTRNFQFSIPDVSWLETHSNVNVIDGLYSVTLGNGDTPTPLPQLFEGTSERQLIISVDGNVLSPVTLNAPYQSNFFTGEVQADGLRANGFGGVGSWDLNTVDNPNGGPGDWRAFMSPNWYNDGAANAERNGALALFGPRDDGEGLRALISSRGATSAESFGFVELSGYQRDPKLTLSAENLTGRMEILENGQAIVQVFAADAVDGNGDPTGDRFGLINLSETSSGYESFLGSGRLEFRDPFGGPDGNGASYGTNGLSLFGADNEINAQLTSNWMNGGAEGQNRPHLIMWGDEATRTATGVDIWRVAVSVRDDGFGKDVGWLALNGPHNGTNTAPSVPVKAFVEAGAFVTDDVGDYHGGQIMLRGVDSDDPLGTFQVQRDENGNEWASLTVRSNDGSERTFDPFGGASTNDPINIDMQAGDPPTSDEFAVAGAISGPGEENFTAGGVRGQASTDNGINIGVLGEASHNGASTAFAYGVLGLADGDADAPRYGIRGEVSGTGSTFPVAVRGINFADAVQDAGSWGAWVDTRGTGAPGSFNVGARTQASKDAGTNVGLHALAQNGDENWAAWFEGPIQINDNQMSVGKKNWEPNPELPFFAFRGTDELSGDVGDCDDDPNTPDEPCPFLPDLIWMDVVQDDGSGNQFGSITLRSTDGNEITIDPYFNGGGGGGGTDLNVNDPDGNQVFSVYSIGTDDDNDGNTPDVAPYAGEMFLWGNNTPNVQFGAPVWEQGDAAGRGRMSMYGNSDDGGGWYRSFINIDVGDQGNGEYGSFGIEGPTSPNFEFSAAAWEPGGADRPYMNMRGSIQTEFTNDNGTPGDPNDDFQDFYYENLVDLQVQDDGQGGEMGVIHLRGTNGADFRLDANGLGNTPFEFVNVQNGNGNNTVVEISNHGTDGNYGFMRLNGTNDQERILLTVNEDGPGDGWGQMNIYSPNGLNNISTNYKTWESGNEDLPLFTMRGIQQVSGGIGDCDGDPNTPDEECFYHPDLVNLEVSDDGNGGEVGGLNVAGTNNRNARLDAGYLSIDASNGQSIQFGPDAGPDAGDESNLPYFFMFGDDGGNSPVDFRIGDSGDGDYGRMILNGPNGNNIFMTGADGSAGFTGSLQARDLSLNTGDNRNVQSGIDNGSGFPYLWLFGDDGGFSNVNLEMADDGSGDYGRMWVNNQFDNSAVTMNGNDGSIEFNGPSGEYFRIDYNGINGGSSFQGINIQNPAMDLDVAQLGQRGTNGNFGYLSLFNDAGEAKAEFRVEDDGMGSNFGFLEINNNWNQSSIQIHGSSGGIRLSDATGNTSWITQSTLDGLNGNTITKDNFVANTLITTQDLTVNGTFNNISDARFKDNVETIDNAIDKTSRLRGVTYNWNKLAADNKGVPEGQSKIGVIAQEVEDVLPELVTTNEDGYKSVDYVSMVAVLIESIKELNAKIAALESENTELKASLETAEANAERIETLTTQMNTLQQLINNLVTKPGQNDDEVEITEQQ